MAINPTGPIDLDASMPKESTLDKIMGGIGTAGNVMQSMQQAQALQQQQAQAKSFQDALLKYLAPQGGQP
jgi:hypothetical protein